MCVPVLKKDADIYIFTRFDIYPLLLDILPVQIKFKNVLVWDKNAQGMGDLNHNWCYTHEFILYAKKGRRRLNKRSLSVLHYPFHGDFSKTIHPTKKPIGLCNELILNSTQEGDTVLDPFLGSGTTLRSCRETNRNGIGYEIDPQYKQTIIDRAMLNIPTLV
jgi:DNA modification methylase